jgi:predicted nucleotidyltransferase
MEFSTCTELELWQYVALELNKAGIKTVLVGGAVVAIYSNGAYRSGDLDIVINSYVLKDKDIASVMQNIGFKKEGRHWFIRPPVAIGDDYQIKPEKFLVNKQELFILSPKDCVRDRLAGYAYFKSAECLDQAALVAMAKHVNLNELSEWAASEGKEMQQALEELKQKIKNNATN